MLECALTDCRRAFLVQFETHFHADLHSHGSAVLGGGFKTPLLNRFDGFLIETHGESALNTDVVRFAIGTDNHSEDTSPFILGLTRLLGVLGIWCCNRFGSKYSTAHAEHTAANTAAR